MFEALGGLVGGVASYIPQIIFALFVIYFVVKKVKDKGGYGGSGDDRYGERVIKNLVYHWDQSQIMHKGGDNGKVEELGGDRGIIINGDQPVPGGKAETAVWSWKGKLRDKPAFKLEQRHRGKCYGVKKTRKGIRALISRIGNMDKALPDVEVVDPLKPEDDAKSWTMQQVKGLSQTGNHSYVRGYTGGQSVVLAPILKDNGMFKLKFASWNAGAHIVSCADGNDMDGPGAWKVVGKMKPAGARKGMATTISAVRPPKCANALVGMCDMITGHAEIHVTTPGKNIVGILSGKTRRIFGPSDMPKLRAAHNIARRNHPEFGNSQESANTGPLTVEFFFYEDGQADMVVTGTYEMDAVFAVPITIVYQ